MARLCMRESLYSVWLEKRVGEYLSTVRPTFTLKELAAWSGAKVTPSFRKRIKTMVHTGALGFFYAVQESGGSVIVYTAPSYMQEIPF